MVVFCNKSCKFAENSWDKNFCLHNSVRESPVVLFYCAVSLLKMLTVLQIYTRSVLIAVDINYLLSFATNNGIRERCLRSFFNIFKLYLQELQELTACDFSNDVVITTLSLMFEFVMPYNDFCKKYCNNK